MNITQKVHRYNGTMKLTFNKKNKHSNLTEIFGKYKGERFWVKTYRYELNESSFGDVLSTKRSNKTPLFKDISQNHIIHRIKLYIDKMKGE